MCLWLSWPSISMMMSHQTVPIHGTRGGICALVSSLVTPPPSSALNKVPSFLSYSLFYADLDLIFHLGMFNFVSFYYPLIYCLVFGFNVPFLGPLMDPFLFCCFFYFLPLLLWFIGLFGFLDAGVKSQLDFLQQGLPGNIYFYCMWGCAQALCISWPNVVWVLSQSWTRNIWY